MNPADVEMLPDEEEVPEEIRDEITDPAIRKDLLLADIADGSDTRNPEDDIGSAIAENPDAFDAMFDGMRAPSLAPPAPIPNDERPTTRPPPPATPSRDEDEDDAFYAKLSPKRKP